MTITAAAVAAEAEVEEEVRRGSHVSAFATAHQATASALAATQPAAAVGAEVAAPVVAREVIPTTPMILTTTKTRQRPARQPRLQPLSGSRAQQATVKVST